MDATGPEPTELWHTALKIRKAIQKQVDKHKTVTEVDLSHLEALELLLADLRLACVSTIFRDFKYSINEKVEAVLWHAHSLVNAEFRRAHGRLHQHHNALIVARRKVERAWQIFLNVSSQFYLGYVQRLAQKFAITEFHDILTHLNAETDLDARLPSESVGIELKGLVLQSCHSTIIRLGDLVRYQNQARPKSRLLQDAIIYYSLAHDLMPNSGHAHHQMGIIALTEQKHLDIIYHFYRALTARTPHPIAKQNLEAEFQAIQENLPSAKSHGSKVLPSDTLVKWFAKLQALLYTDFCNGCCLSQQDELEHEIVCRVERLLRDQEAQEVVEFMTKLVLVNFSAFQMAKVRAIETKQLDFQNNMLRLSIRFITVLNSVLTAELDTMNQSMSRPSTGTSAQLPEPLQERWTAYIMDRVLPPLRLYYSWLVCYRIDIINAERSTTVAGLDEMHRSVAKVGTALLEAVYGEKLRTSPYLLREDQAARGLDAFDSEHLPLGCKFDFDEEKKVLKTVGPNHLDERLNATQEALARVFDISRAIYFLAADDKYPLRVHLIEQPSGYNFTYSYVEADHMVSAEVPRGGEPTVSIAEPSQISVFGSSSVPNLQSPFYLNQHMAPSATTLMAGKADRPVAKQTFSLLSDVPGASHSFRPEDSFAGPGSGTSHHIKPTSDSPVDHLSLASLEPTDAVPRQEALLDVEVEADLLRRLHEFTMPPEADPPSKSSSQYTPKTHQRLTPVGLARVEPSLSASSSSQNFGTFPQLPWNYFVNPSPTWGPAVTSNSFAGLVENTNTANRPKSESRSMPHPQITVVNSKSLASLGAKQTAVQPVVGRADAAKPWGHRLSQHPNFVSNMSGFAHSKNWYHGITDQQAYHKTIEASRPDAFRHSENAALPNAKGLNENGMTGNNGPSQLNRNLMDNRPPEDHAQYAPWFSGIATSDSANSVDQQSLMRYESATLLPGSESSRSFVHPGQVASQIQEISPKGPGSFHSAAPSLNPMRS